MPFKTFPIASIWFDRDQRQRRDLGKLTELKQSITAVGLINPIVITSDGELIAGERRYQSCLELGWTSVPVHFKEDCSTTELKKIELDENVKRLSLPWQDRTVAVLSYHNLCKSTKPDWTHEETAEALGYDRSWVTSNLQVAKAIESGDERIANVPEFSTASNILKRAHARAADSEQELIETLTDFESDFTIEEAKEHVKTKRKQVPLLNKDFTEWQSTYAGPKFNLIHCDFPYGINADKHDQGKAKSHGGYEDSQDTYLKLLDTLGKAMDNVVADSAHLIFWYSPKFHEDTFDILTLMGWRVNPYPLIWHRSDNSGILPDPQRGPRQIYETAFFASRGDRLIVRAKSNLIGARSTKEIHMSEKPRTMLRHFFEMVVDENTTMLDPTCGSANAVRVAREMGAAKVLGIEREKEFYQLAKEAWKDE